MISPAAWRDDLVHAAWARLSDWGSIRAGSRRARRFGRFGDGSIIGFPQGAIYNERYIHIGSGCLLASNVSVSAGMGPDQAMVSDPVVRIGDGVLIGRGSSVVGHLQIDIGDDVFTGPNVYVTDQNHAYEDLGVPIGRQPPPPEEPVLVGRGSWLGTGVVLLPGTRLGEHVVVAANSVVRGEVPARCVVAGAPARVVRRWTDTDGWVAVGGTDR